eukprot:523782_1
MNMSSAAKFKHLAGQLTQVEMGRFINKLLDIDKDIIVKALFSAIIDANNTVNADNMNTVISNIIESRKKKPTHIRKQNSVSTQQTKPPKHAGRYSKHEEELVIDMLANNQSYSQIAEIISRTQSAIISHFDPMYFARYHQGEILKLWRTFNDRYGNDNSDVINILTLKIKDEVYYYNNLYCDHWSKYSCIGWMKSKIVEIDVYNERIKIKHDAHNANDLIWSRYKWVHDYKDKIRLNGNNLYCYDGYYNKICTAEKWKPFSKENKPTLKMQHIVKCSCNKLMEKTSILNNTFLSNRAKDNEIIQCINCGKKVISKSYILYFSDQKNDIHSTQCIMCNKCVDRQFDAILCKKIKSPIYEF